MKKSLNTYSDKHVSEQVTYQFNTQTLKSAKECDARQH